MENAFMKMKSNTKNWFSFHFHKIKENCSHNPLNRCQYIANGCVLVLLFLSFLMLVFTQLSLNRVVSICYAASFIFTFTLLGVELILSIKTKKNILLIVMAGLLLLISCIAPLRVIAYPSKLKKFLYFVTTIALLYSAIVGEWFTLTKKSIIWFAQIIAIFTILVFLIRPFNYDEDGLMKFYFDNANKAAIIFNALTVLLLIGICFSKKWIPFVLNNILAIVLTIFIYLTHCRMAFFAQFIFLILIVGCSYKWFFKSYLYIPIILSSFLFAGFLCLAYKNNWLNPNFLGKGIYARATDYWLPTFESPFKMLLFGKYDYYIGVNGQNRISFQMHNMLVDVLASYGIFSLLLFVAFCTIGIIKFLQSRLSNKMTYLSLCGFLMAFFIGWTEAIFVAGGLCYYILAILPLFFAEHKETKLPKHNREEMIVHEN